MTPLLVLGLTYVSLSLSLSLFCFRSDCIELDFKEISYLVQVIFLNMLWGAVKYILLLIVHVGIKANLDILHKKMLILCQKLVHVRK